MLQRFTWIYSPLTTVASIIVLGVSNYIPKTGGGFAETTRRVVGSGLEREEEMEHSRGWLLPRLRRGVGVQALRLPASSRDSE